MCPPARWWTRDHWVLKLKIGGGGLRFLKRGREGEFSEVKESGNPREGRRNGYRVPYIVNPDKREPG